MAFFLRKKAGFELRLVTRGTQRSFAGSAVAGRGGGGPAITSGLGGPSRSLARLAAPGDEAFQPDPIVSGGGVGGRLFPI